MFHSCNQVSSPRTYKTFPHRFQVNIVVTQHISSPVLKRHRRVHWLAFVCSAKQVLTEKNRMLRQQQHVWPAVTWESVNQSVNQSVFQASTGSIKLTIAALDTLMCAESSQGSDRSPLWRLGWGMFIYFIMLVCLLFNRTSLKPADRLQRYFSER